MDTKEILDLIADGAFTLGFLPPDVARCLKSSKPQVG